MSLRASPRSTSRPRRRTSCARSVAAKERRVDPQIIVGLLVDRAGFPLRISCWEGNRAETTTIVSVVEQFRQAAKVEPLVVVAGRRHAVNRQPERPKRGRSRLHRRLTHHPRPWGTWRPTSTGTGTPSPMGRSSTPSPPEEARGASGTRAASPSRCGTRTPIQARGGRCGHTPRSVRPGTTRP